MSGYNMKELRVLERLFPKKNHIYKKNSKPFKITQLIINLRKLGFAGIEFPYYRFYSNDRNLEKIKNNINT